MRFRLTDPEDPTPFYMTPRGKLILVGVGILILLALKYLLQQLYFLFLWIEQKVDLPLSLGVTAFIYLAIPSFALYAWYLKKSGKTPSGGTAIFLKLSSDLAIALGFALGIGILIMALVFALIGIRASI